MYPLQGLSVMPFQPQRPAIHQSGGATSLQLLLNLACFITCILESLGSKGHLNSFRPMPLKIRFLRKEYIGGRLWGDVHWSMIGILALHVIAPVPKLRSITKITKVLHLR